MASVFSIEYALRDAARTLGGSLEADHVWGGLTCSEIESLANVFRLAGADAFADELIRAHGEQDDDPDDQHHDRYLAAQLARWGDR